MRTRRPLRVRPRASEDPSDTRSILLRPEALGERIGRLIGCRHPVETKMPELCAASQRASACRCALLVVGHESRQEPRTNGGTLTILLDAAPCFLNPIPGHAKEPKTVARFGSRRKGPPTLTNTNRTRWPEYVGPLNTRWVVLTHRRWRFGLESHIS